MINPVSFSRLYLSGLCLPRFFMPALANALGLGLLLLPLFAAAELKNPPERLVAAGGTLTDIIYALGQEQRLAAVDTTSTSPAQALALPKVGYYRSLSTEGVLKFSPDALWAIEGAGSDKTLEQIDSTEVDLTLFERPKTLNELYQLIQNIASRLEADAAGETLIRALRDDVGQPKPAASQSALFIMQASERGLVAAGSHTVPALLLQYNGIRNIAIHDDYKPLTLEYLVVNQPDFLIAPAHVVASAGGRDNFCKSSSLKLVKAAQECNLLVMDSLLALGMTTRLPEAIRLVAEFAGLSVSAATKPQTTKLKQQH